MPGVIAVNAATTSISSIQEKLKGLGEDLLEKEGEASGIKTIYL